MEQWAEIRRQVLVAGVSRRQILRETGRHWQTLRKILAHSEPPGYRQERPRARLWLGPCLGRIEQILQEDQAMPRQQRHTAKRIFVRLRAGGTPGLHGGEGSGQRFAVDAAGSVRAAGASAGGSAGGLWAGAGEAERESCARLAFLVMALPYSDAVFVQAFERKCTEMFWAGHVQGFEFFGGVPRRISYDNTKITVSQILGGGKGRRLTRGFCQLKCHYLFEHHFGRPARGNEKGVVEGLVKFTRLNFFVPVPPVRDWAELNARLREQCVADRDRRLRGHPGPQAQLLAADQAAFLPLPAAPFGACRQEVDDGQQPLAGTL